MQLERIALEDFRNYHRQELCLPPGATILAGENAQGKTNLLEAIFLLTGSRSWPWIFSSQGAGGCAAR